MTTKNFLKQELDTTLLFMLEKNQMLKKFMLIQIFYVLGLNIFAQYFLTNGLRKGMGNLFLENQIFHHNYSYSNISFFKKKKNFLTINFNRFIYCGIIEMKNLQGPDVLKLLIAVNELNINSLVSYIQEFLVVHQTEFLRQNPTEILETIYQH